MFGSFISAKKREDRWWRFHTLKAEYLKAQQVPPTSQAELRSLDRSFRRLRGPVAPGPLQEFWQQLVALGAVRKKSLEVADQDRLEDAARQLEPGLLPPPLWLDLYRLCLGIGFFQAGNALRDHAMSQLVMEAELENAGLEALTLGWYAQVEKGHFDLAETNLARMARLGCPKARIAQAAWLNDLLAGHEAREKIGFAESASAVDLDFCRFVEDSRVALVGPVPSRETQGAEIDSHDVVVKFGYRGGDKGRDPETQGRSLDISYYNNAQSKQLAQSAAYEAVFPDIRWAVFHNRKGRSLFPADYEGLRQLTSFQWLMPDSHLNAGPNAVLDLLRFSPASIRVYNTDLMLSSGRFAGYTPAGAKPVDYTRSFIKTHDPVMQFQLMHRLWTNGLIAGDKRFDEVMGMGLRNYLSCLQKAHGAGEQALF